MDPSVARRARLASILAGATLLLGLSVYALVVRHGRLDAKGSFAFAVVITLGLGIVTLAFRTSVLRSAYNKQLFALIAVGCLSLVASRAVGWIHGSPVEHTLTHDMISFAVISAVGAVTTARWLGWITAFCTLSTVVAVVVERSAPILFTALSFFIVVAAIVAWRRKEASAEDD